MQEQSAPELNISLAELFFIIVKAREFDEKVAPSDEDSGSNPSDDRNVDILESLADDPTLQELQAALRSLNIDQQVDLLALAWLGRGDYDGFAEARAEAEAVTTKRIPEYLVGTPLLGDYLEEGVSQLGYSLEEFEINRL